MEFTIEELPAKSARSSSRVKTGLFCALRNNVISGILWMSSVIKRHASSIRNLLQKLWQRSLQKRMPKSIIKREFLLFSLIITLVILAVVGRDIWQSQMQQQLLSQHQQTFREKSITLQTLRQQSKPFITALQYEWIREVEGNSDQILRLLKGIPPEIAADIRLSNFQKSRKDSKFYIEGTAANFETLFQLENYFKINNWYAAMTLRDDDLALNQRDFQLKLIALNVMNRSHQDREQ